MVLFDRDEVALARAASALPAGSVDTIVADTCDDEQTRGFVERTLQRHGRIDTLFCNAGIEGVAAPVVAYPAETFQRVLMVNVVGTLPGLEHVLPVMQKQGSGGRVNTIHPSR